MSLIFICYRRDDAAGHVGRVVGALRQWYPADQVFVDVASIDGGRRWSDQIQSAIESCVVMYCLIGSHWNASQLHIEGDVVRRELASAISKGKIVIPLLFDSGKLPDLKQLPPDCLGLLDRQGVRFDATDFARYDDQLSRLQALTQTVVEEQYAAGIPDARVAIEFRVTSNRGNRDVGLYLDNIHVRDIPLRGTHSVVIEFPVGKHKIEIKYYWANPAARSMTWHGYATVGSYEQYFEAGMYTALVERYQPPIMVNWDKMTFRAPRRASTSEP